MAGIAVDFQKYAYESFLGIKEGHVKRFSLVPPSAVGIFGHNLDTPFPIILFFRSGLCPDIGIPRISGVSTNVIVTDFQLATTTQETARTDCHLEIITEEMINDNGLKSSNHPRSICER